MDCIFLRIPIFIFNRASTALPECNPSSRFDFYGLAQSLLRFSSVQPTLLWLPQKNSTYNWMSRWATMLLWKIPLLTDTASGRSSPRLRALVKVLSFYLLVWPFFFFESRFASFVSLTAFQAEIPSFNLLLERVNFLSGCGRIGFWGPFALSRVNRVRGLSPASKANVEVDFLPPSVEKTHFFFVLCASSVPCLPSHLISHRITKRILPCQPSCR